jgi:serine/threonine protein phosphatase PrpC
VNDVRALAGDALIGAACTDPGRARSNNEDLPLIDPARGIYGVIDGVGGQAGGEIAAAIARDVILQRLARPLGTPAERVREAIAIANNEIFRRAQESAELRGMACVVTIAVVADGRMVIGHVGDTRLYKIRADSFRKITRDHSPVGEREDAGELNEAEAMRHPRRNEVFRDVGSVFRDKDEQEFVDVIEEPLEPDCAILVCSDGLSDMLQSPTIAHIVRQYAGDPARIVEALVAAANDAGGKDNVTAVYAEGPYFAAIVRGELPDTLTPTEPLDKPRRAAAAAAPAPATPTPGAVARAAGAVVRSRTTWFVTGALLGVLGALALMLYVSKTQVKAAQTLVVAANGSAPFLTISEAIAKAAPGDTVRVEPGEYIEQIVIADGVDLIARIPGTVTISRPRNLSQAVPSLIVGGEGVARVAGIRISSAAEMTDATAVSVIGAGVSLDMVQIGRHRRAIDLAPGASVAMQGSRVDVGNSLASVPETAQATLTNNIIVRVGAATDPPIAAGGTTRLTLAGNVFAGFDGEIVRGVSPARRKEILSGNIIVPPPQARTPRRGAEGAH